MDRLEERINEAIRTWVNDSRSINELKSVFLTGGVEEGFDIKLLDTFLDIFIPAVIDGRKEQITRYCHTFWTQSGYRRARAKMKAATMCGFFERRAAQ